MNLQLIPTTGPHDKPTGSIIPPATPLIIGNFRLHGPILRPLWGVNPVTPGGKPAQTRSEVTPALSTGPTAKTPCNLEQGLINSQIIQVEKVKGRTPKGRTHI